ncbi:MAG TPA: AAA family ATPase, partial [Polyangiales bacterium]|nr:AAA family ATPase [Polyangiales bacterium]
MTDPTFVFEDFALDLANGELRRADERVPIQSKPLALLGYLLQTRGRVATKDELLAQIWPGVSVSESALTSALRDLRRALGDDVSPHRLIVTIRGKGYRFTGTTAAATQRPEPRASEDGPFVERSEVLAQLGRSLEIAAHGALRISLLAGPAGIGKTRTALELARIARSRGIEVVLSRCYGGDGATPFWPWLKLVRRAWLELEADALSARERTLLQPLAGVPSEPASDGTESERRDSDRLAGRFRLFEAFAALARAYCRARPLVVVIDDLHWGDESSLLLLEFVAQQLHDVPLHLVCALRDGEVGLDHPLARVLGTIAGQTGAERIDLAGLQSESVAALLHAAGGRAPSGAFVDKVQRATAGNPFFVSEIARLIAAGQLDPCEDGKEVPVPSRVRDAVRLHVKRRSDECEALLRLASVVGRHIELVPLASASHVSQTRALELLGEAEGAGLLRRVEARVGRYEFVHDLVRETIYRDLGTSARIELHRQMASALEAHGGDERLEELAYHYCEAAEASPDAARKALHYATRAAQRAVSLMAYEDAAAQYDRALNAFQLLGGGDPAEAARLLLSRAEAAWGTLEDAQQVQRRFERAAQSAREIG